MSSSLEGGSETLPFLGLVYINLFAFLLKKFSLLRRYTTDCSFANETDEVRKEMFSARLQHDNLQGLRSTIGRLGHVKRKRFLCCCFDIFKTGCCKTNFCLNVDSPDSWKL